MKAKTVLVAGLLDITIAAYNGIMIPDILEKIVFISIPGTIGLLCFFVCIRISRRAPK